MAGVHHSRNRAHSLQRMKSLGKRTRDESGKHPVNKDDEENVAGSRVTTGLAGLRPLSGLAIDIAAQKKSAWEIPGHFEFACRLSVAPCWRRIARCDLLIPERGPDSQQGLLKRREIVLHGIPDNLAINPLILVT